ncbi:hypothetical protein WMW72_32265 [Paenibacillus filicis]|uniref:Uncharacterized protein n=1 Tax=Paenibacillus filicis TaxID=669464 RepID=A0ABU9DV32_9BACL
MEHKPGRNEDHRELGNPSAVRRIAGSDPNRLYALTDKETLTWNPTVRTVRVFGLSGFGHRAHGAG